MERILGKGLLFLAVYFSISCTHQSMDKRVEVRSTDILEEDFGEYVVVEFPPGKEHLGEAEKEKIRYLKKVTDGLGPAAEIEVLAWSDQEFPITDASPSLSEKHLADQRGHHIKSFLKEDLGAKEEVDVHNLAERPAVFGEIFSSYDSHLKNALQKSEEVASELGLVTENKGSKAVVLVRFN